MQQSPTQETAIQQAAMRQASPMRQDPDVLVIGGGVAGLFCAYHLRRAGSSVAVVERGPVGGPQSSSTGNTGFVGTQGAAPLAEPGNVGWGPRRVGPLRVRPSWDPELRSWLRHFRRSATERDTTAAFRVLLDLKKRSLAILRELCATGPLAATFTGSGMVLAFRTPEGYDRACRSIGTGAPLRVLDLAELHALEPGVEFDIHGALYNDEGAVLHAEDFVAEFARTLVGLGVDLHAATDVTGFEVAGSTVTRVRTTRGDFRPQEVVIAAGAWSAACARRLGVGLALQPVKGYSVTVRTPPHAPRRPVLLGEGRVAVAPLGDRLRFAGVLELSGFNRRVLPRRVNGILRTVRAYLPGLAPAETVQTWSGLRPSTPDSLPYLGRAEPYGNLSIATGLGHIGMGLAPAAGRLVAQLITGESPDTDPTPLRINRFSDRS